jgi:hypothetical protein
MELLQAAPAPLAGMHWDHVELTLNEKGEATIDLAGNVAYKNRRRSVAMSAVRHWP